VLKDNEALEAIIKGRIADHEAEEKAKAEARAEAERERIRDEERAALAKEQAAKEKAERERIAAEQRERDAAERQRQEKERAEHAAERERLAAEAAPQPVAELSDTAFVAELTRTLDLQPTATATLQHAATPSPRPTAPAVAAERDTVTIARDLYDELLHDQRLLRALEAAGVDNWDGWDIALETLRKQAA